MPKPLPHTGNRTLLLITPQFLLCPSASRADLPTALRPLHPTPQTDVLVPDELPNNIYPALMAGQLVVKFMRDAVKHGQSRPWYGGEIVMLVMQTHVVGKDIERSIVRERLRKWDPVLRVPCCGGLLLENVVLGDEVARTGVQRAGQERAQKQVYQRLSPNIFH